jgi:chromosome segregation protein
VAAVAPALAAAEERLAALGERHDEALAAVTRTRIELEERRAVAARADEELRRARRRTETAALRLTEVEARLAGLPAAQAACRQLAAGLEPLCVRLATTVERLAAEAAGVDERVADRSLARRLADDEIELRRAADDLAERRAAVQVEVARLEERRADVAARFEAVAAQLETNVFAAPENEAEAAALSSRIERLERKGESIGPVNPLAEAECGRLQEHVDFLREQTSDLKKSVAELETLIGELTQRIEGDFDATFATVQENFARMAAVLFPGGSGRLQLVSGEEEGEPDGVGIEVKPARKLGKQLALLSGGERSLVALAFLLALLLSRPCPFYILDEVEAALDDINIGRFVSLVRDHRARTQFIIITHQKRTMEAADVLYGVTMGPDGTSQVVSARLAEEEIERQKDRG